MCSNTPLSTAGGALAAGGWEDCMVRVTGSPRGRLIRSERRLVAAGGPLGGAGAPGRPVAPLLGRCRPRGGGLGGGGADRREPQAHAHLLGVDLDGRPPLAPRGLPGAALEPAPD